MSASNLWSIHLMIGLRPLHSSHDTSNNMPGDTANDNLASSALPRLEARGLSKTFQQQGKPLVVLHDINLSIQSNEFVCLVGASGCGKSTLLNIIAGLVSPPEGEVLIDGEPVRGPGSDRGMVFQSYTLFPWLTVAENIAFGLKLQNEETAWDE
jgi:ABC-type nitrate/sulfonate/bicarbonate transport system ATPase subunit